MNEILENSSENVSQSAQVEIIEEVFSTEENGHWIECIVNKGEIIQYLTENKPALRWENHSLSDWIKVHKLKYSSYRLGGKQKKGYKLYRNPFNETPIINLINKDEAEDMPFKN